MEPKPPFLGREYADQFQDESVAQAYRARPAYPSELFPFLASLSANGFEPVLELGSGTGDLSFGFAEYCATLVAVEPSRAMLDVAIRRGRDLGSERIRWNHSSAEDFGYAGPYSLIAAAESLHWMDWSLVMPRI